ncbi:MAG TPA: MmoB/DmpM family protein [Polyangiaceae bacterium]|jgi:toluene monooxygenase system protein D|nr:MmoB/DmpM family protein [Polyangiaceae bacterium]
MNADSPGEGVGPVLEGSPAGRAVVAAIQKLNRDVSVQDRGAYLRVLVPRCCRVTREAIERELGQAFRVPFDLEPLMPAFKGFISMDADSIEWSLEQR